MARTDRVGMLDATNGRDRTTIEIFSDVGVNGLGERILARDLTLPLRSELKLAQSTLRADERPRNSMMDAEGH
jgi:hypothetical protein